MKIRRLRRLVRRDRAVRCRQRRNAFTLTEVMIAVMIIALAMAPALSAIQTGRIAARSTSLEIIGHNLAGSIMELVKRSGYHEIVYGGPLPAILSSASTVSPLLELPRQTGSSFGAAAETLPEGPPGGASDDQMQAFLAAWRQGTLQRDSAVVVSDENYLFFSPDQIAALSGFADADAVGDEGVVLNTDYAWGLYVAVDPAGQSGGAVGYPLKHVAVVVKWRDIRRDRIQYTVLESHVSQVAPRL